MEGNQVCKEGIVRQINEKKIFVEIVVSSACGGCAAKSLCNISEKKNEIIEAQNYTGETFQVGESVYLQMRQSLARKAVLLGYGLPFLVLIIGLFACYALTRIEWLSVIVALALTAIYYWLVKKLDRKLTNDFVFYVVKKG
ncbi:MAG: SoxR reducing system RseC family protein [Bacteroidales bacterium]|nr:SoxR reducing system RseC family protein [Bacteroidales bacterium]